MLNTICIYLNSAHLELLELSKNSQIITKGCTKLWQIVEAQTVII